MTNSAEYPETRCNPVRIVLVLAVWFVATATATSSAYAQTFTTLYNFTGGLDGGLPVAGLALDAANNLYGTTASGGAGSCKNKGLGVGCGTVFKVDRTGKKTVLYSFPGTGARGANPFAGLLRKANGYLYGTTMNGGSIGCNGEKGCGVLFNVSTTKVETTLHTFGEGTDGTFPSGGLIQDASGNLYGTTGWGGNSSCNEGGGTGCGTVFELTGDGAESVLYSFTGAGGDGAIPVAGLVEDAQHNLYGTTEHGGNSGCNNNDGEGCGTVFKMDAERRESVLYAFTGGSDGANPFAGLVEDASGDLYGTTAYGGDLNCNPPTGCGMVFVLSKAGNETVLRNFTGAGGDGAVPYAGLLLDERGNLYGTTAYGGDLNCTPPNGCGTVFELDRSGKETVLHTFAGPDGAGPYSGVLVRDAEGNLYGTTLGGGTHGYGTVFKVNIPEAEITNLQNVVNGLVTAGTLSAGLGQFLSTPLNDALSALGDPGHTRAIAASDSTHAARSAAALDRKPARAAIHDLETFIERVQVLVILRRLKWSEGRVLIDAAESIIKELRGTTGP